MGDIKEPAPKETEPEPYRQPKPVTKGTVGHFDAYNIGGYCQEGYDNTGYDKNGYDNGGCDKHRCGRNTTPTYEMDSARLDVADMCFFGHGFDTVVEGAIGDSDAKPHDGGRAEQDDALEVSEKRSCGCEQARA